MPERTGPGRCHLRRREAFFLFHLQRGEQFTAREILARPVIGERRQRLEHVVVAHLLAVIAFDAPDRDEDVFRHAIAVLQIGEHPRIGGFHLLAHRHAVVGHGTVEIAPHRLDEFRLGQVRALHAGIARDAGHRPVVNIGTDSGGDGSGAEIADEGCELRVRGAHGRRGCGNRVLRGALLMPRLDRRRCRAGRQRQSQCHPRSPSHPNHPRPKIHDNPL